MHLGFLTGRSQQRRRRPAQRWRRATRSGFEVCEPRLAPALLIDVGTHDLLPDTPGQEIEIYIQSDDPANDPGVNFMNLRAEIGNAPHIDPNPGDGVPFDPYPNFENAFFEGGIWDPHAFTSVDQTPGATPWHGESWLAFNGNQEVEANGLAITLVVDTTGFTTGEYPLKLRQVGAQWGVSVATEFGRADATKVPVTITNGLIRVTQPPVVDLNGSDEAGIDFDTFFYQGEQPQIIVDTSSEGPLTVADPDDAQLASAAVTLSGIADAGQEFLSVDTSGSAIAAQYDAGSGVLTLTGSDTVSNYQKVLRTLRYQNQATPVTEGIRTASVVVNDGGRESEPAAAAIDVAGLTYDWHNAEEPNDVNGSNNTVTIADVLIIVATLRDQGARRLPPLRGAAPPDYYDVDASNSVTLNDALLLVARLRADASMGEAEPSWFIVPSDLDDADDEALHDTALLKWAE